ncbi:MAG: UDP-N-acetylmuramate--L-alanine ligase [Planctomycetes bacterium]|nr:UDP-N-acetylmuramate--L-alanine ligase [Planctomycetota bacterium]
MNVPWRRVHLVGVGGTGQSALACLLAESGVLVTGSDAVKGPTWGALAKAGVDAWVGSRPERLGAEIEAVVRSASVPDSDGEVRFARERGIPILKYAEAVGRVVAPRRLLTVSGTHGKTTTCGMLVSALRAARREPGFLIGGERIEAPSGAARVGTSPEFVLEACEYDRSFLQYTPSAAGVTCADPDHLDYFKTPSAFREAFEAFLGRVEEGGTIVLASDARSLRTPPGRRVLRAGFDAEDDWRAVDLEPTAEGTRLCAATPHGTLGPFVVRLPGRHNVANALVAAALASATGAEGAEALSGACAFAGMRRRFEARPWRFGFWVDDYAHHPVELAALIAASRQRYPGRTLWLIFQPHQFVRTRIFLDRFAEVLATADRVLLAPVYGVREEGVSGVDHRVLADAARARGAKVECLDGLPEGGALLTRIPEGSVVLCAGAGDLWRLSEAVRTGAIPSPRVVDTA